MEHLDKTNIPKYLLKGAPLTNPTPDPKPKEKAKKVKSDDIKHVNLEELKERKEVALVDDGRVAAQRKRRELYRYNREVVEMSRANAAIAAGYPARVAQRRGLAVPVTDFYNIFEQRGLTDRAKVDAVLEGMKAMKTVVVDKQAVEVPDYYARHKYIETMLRMCRQADDKDGVKEGRVQDLAERIKAARLNVYESIRICAQAEGIDERGQAEVVEEVEEAVCRR